MRFFYKCIWVFAAMFMLAGCTMITREYHLSQGNTDGGYVTEDGQALPPINIMVLHLRADVDTRTSAEQAIDTELVAAWRAAQAAAARDGYTNIADIYNKLIEGKTQKPAPEVSGLAASQDTAPSKPPETISPAKDSAVPQARLKPYEVGKYRDGRGRYLFRTTMELLPDTFSVLYNGASLHTIDKKDADYSITKTGGRWEPDGRTGPLLKNTDGRKENVTLLLPAIMAQGDVALAY